MCNPCKANINMKQKKKKKKNSYKTPNSHQLETADCEGKNRQLFDGM